MKVFSLLLVVSFLFNISAWADPIRVACVGDSITHGAGATNGWAYPDQLQRLLGAAYQVRNFGVSGTTLLRNGDHPYDKTTDYTAALAFKPDIVIVMLGTNDTKPQNWGSHAAEFEPDYRWLIAQFQAANPALKLYLCRPTWVAGNNRYSINEPVLLEEIPIIDRIAASVHASEIDMQAALLNHPEDLPDTVHPNNTGAGLMAKAAYKALTGKDYQGDVPQPGK